jgi:putative oxidoreductase
MMKAMNMHPSKQWALLAGLSEFGGGTLTAIGALNPLGPISTIAAMSMATAKAHWGKPIWNTKGGAELPVLNMAAALAMALTGPGKISLDDALGIKLPRRLLLVPGLGLVAASVAYAVYSSNQPQPQAEEQPVPHQVKQAGAQQESPKAVNVPEAPTATADDPKKILEEVGLEPLTDEYIEAGKSEHHPA